MLPHIIICEREKDVIAKQEAQIYLHHVEKGGFMYSKSITHEHHRCKQSEIS